ncbi:MAG: mannose-1-phosphate guanylyltransferase/mannose-6-phosphate isomerase [Coxiellaceae bacterium]|nr:mannose-1-phosphate guanylyltransferase/mannose-6-phosphate isomerase [Coxiellaceae bacterium]
MTIKNVPVIIAGGSGSRLWPLSRVTYPKQFINLVDEKHSLLQATLLRIKSAIPDASAPIIVCNDLHRFLVAEQCREIGIQPMVIILEPEAKNTAAAVALAAEYLSQHHGEANMWVMPADHVIDGDEALKSAFAVALDAVEANRLVTFGVAMTHPATGYGYIKANADQANGKGWLPIQRFVEKPDKATAKRFFAEGDYYWNSGMFAFNAQLYLAELNKLASDIFTPVHQAMKTSMVDSDFLRPNTALFSQCRSDSIDYAIMEKTDHTAMVPLTAAWNDVGSWDSLMAQQDADENGNVLRGDVLTHDVNNSYMHAESRLLAVTGLDNVVVVETDDAVLVTDSSHCQDVKKIVEQLKQRKRVEANDHLKMFRPWGWYQTITETENFKVKRIGVNPQQSLSLQRHQHRAEHWVVVSGEATVVNDDKQFMLQHDQSTYIPAGTKHQLANLTDQHLEIIEVQTGSYLGEDDIERFSDQYGRVKQAVTT